MGPWDLEIATLRSRILRAGPWELNFWRRFLVSRLAPQTELTLIVKQVLVTKSWGILVKIVGARVDVPKHLPKYFDIRHNTKKLEKILKLWESV